VPAFRCLKPTHWARSVDTLPFLYGEALPGGTSGGGAAGGGPRLAERLVRINPYYIIRFRLLASAHGKE
jgi:hypothetical protein